ncbi:MAG TPA: DUF3352 domain-containing protein [Actinomycetota bacterium]|nr:DUF3352 domain-containing protein [Actinomycetota bacterium]
MKAKIVAIVIAAVLLVGGGAFALTRFLAPAEDDALAFVPPDAYFYTNFFIDPSNSQKQALDEFVQKFPGVDSVEDLIEKLIEAIDDALEEDGLSYEEDIQPWLGDQFAAYGVPGGTPDMPNGAVLVEVTDEEAAERFLNESSDGDFGDTESKTYKDTEYRVEKDGPIALAFLEGFMVVGTEDAVKESIDALESDETLETSKRFTAATDPLRDDWIGLYYLDTPALFEEFQLDEALSAAGQPALGGASLEDQRPQAGVLYVTSDSAVFEASGSIGEGPYAPIARGFAEPGLVPELPAEAWAAFGIPDLGEIMTRALEAVAGVPGFDPVQLEAMFYAQTGLRLEQDILSWMGDAGFFVQGANLQDIGGGLVLESTDPAKTTAFVGKLRGLLVQQGIRPKPFALGGLRGFSVQIPGTPAPINVVGGDRLAITYGSDATTAIAEAGQTLSSSDAFSAAQEDIGEDFNIAFYVDVDAAQAFGEAIATLGGAVDETYNDEVKPIFDVFTHVVIGAKAAGDDSIVSKMVVGVE